MPVLIQDLLNYQTFSSSEIVAGSRGLLNQILHINLMEITLDEIMNKFGEMPKDFSNTGDLYLTNNIFFKRKNICVYNEIATCIEQGSSGIIIVGYTDGLLDNKTLELANKKGFPIISLSELTAYSEIINTIMTTIIRDKTDRYIDKLLNRIINEEYSKLELKGMLNEINPYLKDNYRAIFVTVEQDGVVTFIRNRVWDDTNNFVINKWNNGAIIILSSNGGGEIIDGYIDTLFNSLEHNYTEFHIGVSNLSMDYFEFVSMIKEAIFSCKTARNRKIKKQNHEDLDVEKWMFNITDDRNMKSYIDDILKPIKDYQDENKIDLLSIVKEFIRNDGNYKLVSEKMFMHENTVRYRIEKIRELISEDDNKIKFHNKLYMLCTYLDVVKNSRI